MPAARYSIKTGRDGGHSGELGLLFHDHIPGWEVEVWLNGASGETRFSEVRVFPPSPDVALSPGLDQALRRLDLKAFRARAIGITREVLRQGLHAPRGFRIPEYEGFDATLAWARAQAAARSVDGKLHHDDRWLAAFASLYVALACESNKVVPGLAEMLGYAPDTVRGLLKECRRRRLLTTPEKPGIAGGRLTPEAKAILAHFSPD